MNKMKKVTNAMKVEDTSTDMTIVMEDLEVEFDSMEIRTIDHDDPSSVLHAIKKATATQTVCINIGLTLNFVLVLEWVTTH